MPPTVQVSTHGVAPILPDTARSDGYWTPEWALVYVTVLLVLVTAFLARYTYKLWDATKRMVVEADKSAKKSEDKMERSIAAAVDAATAMRSLAEAADISAKAAQEEAVVARRMLTATHPPTIVVDFAILRANIAGVTVVEIRLRNEGRSTATLKTCMAYDLARPPGPVRHGFAVIPGLSGQVLPPHAGINAQHVCQEITLEDLKVPDRPSARPDESNAFRMDEPEPATHRRLLFGISIEFTNETGDHDNVQYRMECFPPSMLFTARVLA